MDLKVAARSTSVPSFPLLKENDTINRFKVMKMLGEGSFGAVYQVRDSKGVEYAMKAELNGSSTKVLKMEVVVLRALKESGAQHCCLIYDTGRVKEFRFIVMTLVGPSLEVYRKAVGVDGHLSMGCAISVGIQCLEAIQELHNVGYLHRDVKPGNFAVSLDNPQRVLILDFGLCRRFLAQKDEVRRPRWTAGFRGTLRYASISAHVSRELCRKDDLESWLYQQVELTNGQLPWKLMKDYVDVGHAKEMGRTADLKKLFGGCPKEYVHIMVYIDEIKYYDNPAYAIIRGLLRDALTTNNLSEFPYDWEKNKEKKM